MSADKYPSIFSRQMGCLYNPHIYGILGQLRMVNIREFKQIASAGATTAAGSNFPPKCDAALVRRLHPAVVRNPTT